MSSPTLQRAVEHYKTHWQLSLDLNQSAQSREYHRKEALTAAGVILELSDEWDELLRKSSD